MGLGGYSFGMTQNHDSAPTAAEVAAERFGDAGLNIVCRWFMLCDREAVRYRNHPALGKVPICERCDAKVERQAR